MFATLHTTAGDIRLELFPNHAPRTVRNFVGLATGAQAWRDPQTGAERHDPFYDGLTFHRVIAGFMIQGGCPQGTGRGGPGYMFDDEIHPELQFAEPYLLAMANAGPRRDPLTGRVGGTNGSQFFITVAPTTGLNGRHTIFGKVVDEESKAVVDAISTVTTRGHVERAVPPEHRDVPVEDVTITSVTIED